MGQAIGAAEVLRELSPIRNIVLLVALLALPAGGYAAVYNGTITLKSLTSIANYKSTTVSGIPGAMFMTIQYVAGKNNWQTKTAGSPVFTRRVGMNRYWYIQGVGWSRPNHGPGSSELYTFATFTMDALSNPHRLVKDGTKAIAGRICDEFVIEPITYLHHASKKHDVHICVDAKSGALLEYRRSSLLGNIKEISSFIVDKIGGIKKWLKPIVGSKVK